MKYLRYVCMVPLLPFVLLGCVIGFVLYSCVDTMMRVMDWLEERRWP